MGIAGKVFLLQKTDTLILRGSTLRGGKKLAQRDLPFEDDIFCLYVSPDGEKHGDTWDHARVCMTEKVN